MLILFKLQIMCIFSAEPVIEECVKKSNDNDLFIVAIVGDRPT